MAIIDIDHFKAINDTYGHDAGDAVLRHFAYACRSRLRGQGIVGRLGGEEVLLVMTGMDIAMSLRLIERIGDGFPPAVITESGGELACAFSAGLAEATHDEDRTSPLRRADGVLYAAKKDGRNRTMAAR